MRVVIFANGTLNDLVQARRLSASADIVVAADGGARNARAAGVIPDAVIGDLDSLTTAELACMEGEGTEVISFPERKDETDLELALVYAYRRGATTILVLAALGGRLDQEIANVMLLALPELARLDVRIVDGRQTAFVVRGGEGVRTLGGKSGDTVSLIPVGGNAIGVTTEGLEWALRGDDLLFGPARGVSNVLVSEPATVRVDGGRLLCVVTSQREAIAAVEGGAV
jgi:thiamine pyrophosphokinase